MVKGENSNEVIAGLASINGFSIADLEARMQPGRDSATGFLSRDDNLSEVLAQDNTTVRSRGFTHQELADHLRYVYARFRKGYEPDFTYRGIPFHVEDKVWLGSQSSPFMDDTGSNCDLQLTNLNTGETIRFFIKSIKT